MTSPYAERIMADVSENCLRVRLPAEKLTHILDNGIRFRVHADPLGPVLLAMLLKDVCQSPSCKVVVKKGKGCDAFGKITFPRGDFNCIFGVNRIGYELEIVLILTAGKNLGGRDKVLKEVPEFELIRGKINKALANDFGVSMVRWTNRTEFERSYENP